VDYLLSGESEFGFLPLVIAAGKGLGKTVHNVAVNAQAEGAGAGSTVPVVSVPQAPASSSVMPVLLASAVGLGIGLLAGYAVGHARA
jgi:hypothetical protein